MNEIIEILLSVFLGCALSSFLVYVLVYGFDWKVGKAIGVAPFAIVIVPVFLVVVLPLIIIGEVMKSILVRVSGMGQRQYRWPNKALPAFATAGVQIYTKTVKGIYNSMEIIVLCVTAGIFSIGYGLLCCYVFGKQMD